VIELLKRVLDLPQQITAHDAKVLLQINKLIQKLEAIEKRLEAIENPQFKPYKNNDEELWTREQALKEPLDLWKQ